MHRGRDQEWESSQCLGPWWSPGPGERAEPRGRFKDCSFELEEGLPEGQTGTALTPLPWAFTETAGNPPKETRICQLKYALLTRYFELKAIKKQ